MIRDKSSNLIARSLKSERNEFNKSKSNIYLNDLKESNVNTPLKNEKEKVNQKIAKNYKNLKC